LIHISQKLEVKLKQEGSHQYCLPQLATARPSGSFSATNQPPTKVGEKYTNEQNTQYVQKYVRGPQRIVLVAGELAQTVDD
jgi:hypothetical protein